MKKISLIILVMSLCLPEMPGQKQPYVPGEKVNFIVKFGVMNGGTASFEIRSDTLNGVPVWYGAIKGQTTGLADVVYKVRDSYESYIDPATDLPLFTIRNISEGRYRKYNEVTYDHTARSDSTVLMSDLSGQHIAPKGVLDIVSCFYWFRKYHLAQAKSLSPGDVFTMITWFTDELYPITLKYSGTEMVRIKGGKVLCHRFNPVTEVGRVFKTEDDMAMWFTADENFLPVKIRFDIFVGSFNVDMISNEGLKTPLIIN